jgi:hypothetical protein
MTRNAHGIYIVKPFWKALAWKPEDDLDNIKEIL